MSQEKKILVMPNSPQYKLNGNENTLIVSLPHPKTNKSVKFLVKDIDCKCTLYEINRHLENPSSWLVNNDSVTADGSIMFATPFDPLFILLSLLHGDKSGKFLLLDQLFAKSTTTYAGEKLVNCLSTKAQLNNIADAADHKDFTAYRYNEEKTMKWLKKKVQNTVATLNETNIFVEEQENISSEDSRLCYGCGIVCEYLSDDLVLKLKKHLSISEKPPKRKIAGSNSSNKKAKIEPTDDYSNLLPKNLASSDKKSMTRAEKTLSKVDKKGMKTMSSYFKVKSKK